MLSHARSDDSAFFHVLGEITELLNDALRFDKAVRSLLLISKREALFPIIDLAEPFRTGLLLFDEWKKECQIGSYVSFYRFCCLNDLVNVFRHDLEVDDAYADRVSIAY